MKLTAGGGSYDICRPGLQIDGKGQIIWRDALVGRLVRTDSLYAPRAEVWDSGLLSTEQKARIVDRLGQFIQAMSHNTGPACRAVKAR